MTDASTHRRTVRTAIVGLGMGHYHIPEFRKHPQCEVVGFCDVNPERVDHTCRTYNVDRGFTSIDDLLDWGEFDLISLALPNDLHEPVTIRCLEAGYHIMAEKPLARNAQEGERIVQAAEKSGRKIAMHYNQRMSREHQLIRRAFEAGDFGEVTYIRAGWMRQRGIPGGAGAWFQSRERAGGGPLIDLGVHMLDSALWCAGFPRALRANGQVHQHFADRDIGLEHGMEVEDFANAYIRCENGLTITLEASWAGFHDNREEAYLHLYGTEGGAHRSTRFAPGWVPTTELFLNRRRYGAVLSATVDEWPTDIRTVQEDLVDAILHDRDPVCTAQQGLIVLRILDAIYESARSGREVEVTQ